jgi:uncharacterized protein
VPKKLRFSRLTGGFAICRLSPGTVIPDWAPHGSFYSVTSTAEELSVVCAETQVPANVPCEGAWACLKLEGPFPFSETGILAGFVQPLAERAIPVFAISTFDTDYVLVKDGWLERALAALRDAGYEQLK